MTITYIFAVLPEAIDKTFLVWIFWTTALYSCVEPPQNKLNLADFFFELEFEISCSGSTHEYVALLKTSQELRMLSRSLSFY